MKSASQVNLREGLNVAHVESECLMFNLSLSFSLVRSRQVCLEIFDPGFGLNSQCSNKQTFAKIRSESQVCSEQTYQLNKSGQKISSTWPKYR